MQQALPAIIFAALRRFLGAVLFLGPRPSSRLGAPFWPSGLTVRRSRPPTAAAELRALGCKKGISLTISSVVTGLNFLSALAAFAAAFLWHRSATIQIPHKEEADENGMYSAAIVVGNNTDFISTAFAQSTWSRRGAYAAAVAALFQGIALLLQSIAA